MSSASAQNKASPCSGFAGGKNLWLLGYLYGGFRDDPSLDQPRDCHVSSRALESVPSSSPRCKPPRISAEKVEPVAKDVAEGLTVTNLASSQQRRVTAVTLMPNRHPTMTAQSHGIVLAHMNEFHQMITQLSQRTEMDESRVQFQSNRAGELFVPPKISPTVGNARLRGTFVDLFVQWSGASPTPLETARWSARSHPETRRRATRNPTRAKASASQALPQQLKSLCKKKKTRGPQTPFSASISLELLACVRHEILCAVCSSMFRPASHELQFLSCSSSTTSWRSTCSLWTGKGRQC